MLLYLGYYRQAHGLALLFDVIDFEAAHFPLLYLSHSSAVTRLAAAILCPVSCL